MMSLEEAIRHCKDIASGDTSQSECQECRNEHLQLAVWLEGLKALRERSTAWQEGETMKNYNIIEITLANGHTATWEADKGEWDDYAYDGKVFIVKKDGSWVGLYNMDHVICVVVK
jgi:hypothetical protein